MLALGAAFLPANGGPPSPTSSTSIPEASRSRRCNALLESETAVSTFCGSSARRECAAP